MTKADSPEIPAPMEAKELEKRSSASSVSSQATRKQTAARRQQGSRRQMPDELGQRAPSNLRRPAQLAEWTTP